MRTVFIFLALSILAACRTPRADGPSTTALELPPVEGGSLDALGPGDLVEIRVFQEPDLTGMWRISAEGDIDYPLCGKVNLGGKPTGDASTTLATCLARGFVRNPQVTVLIKEFNSKKVYVFGEVQKPGTFSFEDHMNIIQAITLAGGFNKVAARNQVNVTRVVNGEEKKVRVPVEDIGRGTERNFVLQPGDIVFVPESLF
jgi:polysaccharide export outer membrane protein